MGNQKINARLTFTMVVQLVMLVGIGLIAYLGMSRIGDAVVTVNKAVGEQLGLGQLGETLRDDLLTAVNNVARGASTWEQAEAALPVAKKNFRMVGKGISVPWMWRKKHICNKSSKPVCAGWTISSPNWKSCSPLGIAPS